VLLVLFAIWVDLRRPAANLVCYRNSVGWNAARSIGEAIAQRHADALVWDYSAPLARDALDTDTEAVFQVYSPLVGDALAKRHADALVTGCLGPLARDDPDIDAVTGVDGFGASSASVCQRSVISSDH
jgi:hypothetical protein